MRAMLRRAQRATVGACVGCALALTTLVAGPAVEPAAGATPAAQPEAWDQACSTVELAGPLSTDLAENGQPVRIEPDARGKFVPVIMVHGWTGRSTHRDERDGAFSAIIDLTSGRFGGPDVGRSLIGQLQNIPGAAVYTYDYHRYSGRWVDDPEVGGGLGDAIDCLAAESGEKVILVGHSMGGLAARYAAAQPGRDGADRAADISTVVTFGTPYTGSILAAVIGGLLDSPVPTLVRAILAYCGAASSDAMESGSVCDAVPVLARAFDGKAGRALRAGSPQLAALEPFPSTIDVHALAGESGFDVPKGGWFALPWETERVPLGDVVVGADSAFSGTEQTLGDECNYQLNAVRAGADQLGMAFRLVAVDETSRLVLTEGASPCLHTNLMRNIELTNEAVGVVADDIGGRTPPDPSELARILDCIGTCDITGVVPVDHPTWGSVVVATTGPSRDAAPGPTAVYVVDSQREIRWFRAVGDGSFYLLAPVGSDRQGWPGPADTAATTPIDSTGNVFLNYNPGRYNGVIALRAVPDGILDFGTIPPANDYAGRFYSAEAIDENGDGRFDIELSINACNPTCADGEITTEQYEWNGSDYVLD